MSLDAFFDPLSLALVLGGSVVVLVLRTPARELARAVRALRVLFRRAYAADATLSQVASLSRIAGRHGVVALNQSVIADPDVAEAVTAIVDGATPEAVQILLSQMRDARAERHLSAIDAWAALAEVAPAMGMIGTLVGLVQMFLVMADPAAIGRAMAVALLTTLYGALVATLVATPVAGRLRRLARAETFERARLDAPLVALARREQPRLHGVAA